VSTTILRAIVVSIVIASAPVAAHAGTVFVASNGTDTGTCGSSSAPCRTLRHAISLAAAGDTILVGPGEYREESAVACGALTEEVQICIDKSIRLLSTSGATATAIRGASVSVIGIAAPGITVGAPRRGFTVIGDGSGSGVVAEADAARIEGNVLVANFRGLQLRGNGFTVSRNLALRNELVGFSVFGSGDVRFNTASGNAAGGFSLGAGPSQPQVVTGNVAVENGECGFCVDRFVASGEVQLTRNAAIGNEVGVLVEGGASDVEVSRNNLYGNASNCGLQASSSAVFTAPANFFGAPGGPGTDPADAVCNASEGNATATVPARRAFRVRGVGAIP
jgi:nitrous oxidase accessory protein NosD